jgi:hypothetical protein
VGLLIVGTLDHTSLARCAHLSGLRRRHLRTIREFCWDFGSNLGTDNHRSWNRGEVRASHDNPFKIRRFSVRAATHSTATATVVLRRLPSCKVATLLTMDDSARYTCATFVSASVLIIDVCLGLSLACPYHWYCNQHIWHSADDVNDHFTVTHAGAYHLSWASIPGRSSA